MKKIINIFILFFIVAKLFANGIWEWDTKNDWEKCERLDCDIDSKAGSVRIFNTLSDDFNSNKLNNFWNFGFADNPGNTFNFNTSGCIRLISYPGEIGWWCLSKDQNPTESIIYQVINKKFDFKVETCIKNSSLYHHPWGKISFFITDENKLNVYRICYGSRQYEVPQGFSFMCRDSCRDYVYWSYYNLTYPVYFKIENKYIEPYNNLTFYYRYSTYTAWTQMYKFENKQFNKMFVGLSRGDTEPNQWVDIDYFYYYGPVTKRAIINSEIKDLGSMPSGQGTIKWIQNLPELTTYPIIFYTQTSDDGIIWSEEWKGPYTNNNGSIIQSTNKRYIRWKGILRTEDERWTPELLKLSIEYPIAAPLPPIISSTAKEDGWINTKNAVFYFSGAEVNGVTVGAYYYILDNDINTQTGLSTTGTYINVTGISEGIHSLKVMAQADWRNNSLCSRVSEYRFNIDTVAPKKPEIIKVSHKQYEESGNNNFNINLKLEDNKTNTINVSGIKGISYRLMNDENEELDNIIDNTTGNISINGIDNGIWYFKAKAIDSAGNTSEVLTYNIKVNFKGAILTKEKAKVYPNPTKGKFKVWYELTGAAEEVKIIIKDTGGRTIKEIKGEKQAGINEIEQELSGLANGVYFVKIKVIRKDGKEDIVIKKLVVYKR